MTDMGQIWDIGRSIRATLRFFYFFKIKVVNFYVFLMTLKLHFQKFTTLILKEKRGKKSLIYKKVLINLSEFAI